MNEIKAFIKGRVGQGLRVTTDIDKKKSKIITGVITEAYESLFVLETNEEGPEGKVQTYTYSDIISNLIEIEEA